MKEAAWEYVARQFARGRQWAEDPETGRALFAKDGEPIHGNTIAALRKRDLLPLPGLLAQDVIDDRLEGMAMRLPSRHLTQPRPDSLDAKMQRTHAGMAHIAGTGPEGKTCRHCKHWANWSGRDRASAGGLLKPAICFKYQEAMRSAGKPVPHHAAACRRFEENDDPPRIAGWIAE